MDPSIFSNLTSPFPKWLSGVRLHFYSISEIDIPVSKHWRPWSDTAFYRLVTFVDSIRTVLCSSGHLGSSSVQNSQSLYFSGKEETFGINDAIAEQNVTFSWCRFYCRDEAFSENFIRTCTLAQFSMWHDFRNGYKKMKRNDKLLGLIGVLLVTSMLHERGSPSVTVPRYCRLCIRWWFQTRFKHGYERKLSMHHGQTFLLKGNFIYS